MNVTNADQLRSALRNGDTDIVLADGIYAGQFDVSRPVCLRAANTWSAHIYSGEPDCLRIEANGVTVRGLRVSGAYWMGIRFQQTSGTQVVDCWVHSCGKSGMLGDGDNHIIQRCLVERNGLTVLDHGLYVCGTRLTVRDNVFRHNAGWGLHGYAGHGGVDVSDSVVGGNIAYGHREKVGLGLWVARRCLVLHNQAWNNARNVEIHDNDGSNLVAGNVDRDLGRWPLVSRPE